MGDDGGGKKGRTRSKGAIRKGGFPVAAIDPAAYKTSFSTISKITFMAHLPIVWIFSTAGGNLLMYSSHDRHMNRNDEWSRQWVALNFAKKICQLLR